MTINDVYNMSNLLLCTCIVGITIIVALLGLLIVRKLRRNPESETNDIVLGLGHQAGILFAIVVGFIAVSVLGAFDKAVKTVEDEANQAFTIWVDARAYPADFELKLRNAVEDYINSVINIEWPLQSQGETSLKTARSLENLYRLIIDYSPTSEPLQAVHTGVINKVNQLFEDRDSRLFINAHGLSSAVYYVIILSTLIIFCFDWALSPKRPGLHIILTILLSIGIGLIFFLIVGFDYPFRGEISVGPESFQKTLEHIQRLNIEQPPSSGI